MNILEARALGKCYGGSWALRECTLAIPDGHVVALVGPNGAGKTTLLNLAVGLTAPTAGIAPCSAADPPGRRPR
jgi:ABC-2 type transport system ATP-binding protein